MKCALSATTLHKLWPKASAATIDAIAGVSGAVFAQYGLTTSLRAAHFMAQASHECGGGTIKRENMNYSAKRLMQIFGVGRHSAAITEAEAAQLEHHPEKIAERVYGLGNRKKAKELGNTRAGDGWRFRGNGVLQLTGGDSHRRIGDATGFDLYDSPEQLEDPATSFRVAVAEFVALKCLPAADADDVRTVTRRVNGGFNGLAERTVWLRKWKAVLGTAAEDVPAEVPEEEAPVPPPAEPRGGESDPAKSILKSKEAAGGTLISGTSVGDAVGQASDTLDKVKSAKDVADDVGLWDYVGPVISNPRFLFAVAIAVVGIAIIYWRWKRNKETGA